MASEERTDSFVFSCFNWEARGHYVLTSNLSVCNPLYFPLLGTFIRRKIFSFQFRYFDSQKFKKMTQILNPDILISCVFFFKFSC